MVEFIDGYLVSENGDVYNKKTMHKRVPQQRNDYLSVSIRNKNYPIHRLVATAYLPNPDSQPVVRHLDGNLYNNHVSNLAWGSAKDNSNDAIEHGTHTFLNSDSFKKHQNKANSPAKVHRVKQDNLPMGVSERKLVKSVKYIAKMGSQRTGQVYLGSFESVEEASEAVSNWYYEQYGVYPNE